MPPQDANPTPSFGGFGVRERQVLPMLAEGRTVQEIGDVLHVSPYTIQTYRKRIMQKLGIHRSNELLMYALRRGLVHLEP